MAQKLTYSANFKRNYMAFFAVFLFVVMVGAEFFLALSIPRFVNRENAFADQIRKREMLLRFDAARRRCLAVQSKNAAVSREKRLLSDTLDHLSIYFRKEADNLTAEDVDRLDPVVTDLFKIASRLEKGTPYSNENKLDSSMYLNRLLKKHTGK